MFSRLVLPEPLRAEVVAHATADAPNECCGLLAGHIAGGNAVVTARFAVRNELGSPTDYRTDARDLLRAFREMRERGLELLAIYHSHPTSAAVPSRRDRDGNTYGESVVHLIVGLSGAVPEVRAWWLGDGAFREAALIDNSRRGEPS